MTPRQAQQLEAIYHRTRWEPVWRILIVVALALGVVANVRAQERTLTTPRDGVNIAFLDSLTLDDLEARLVRYVWVPDNRVETAAAISLAINSISRNTVPYQPELLRSDRGMVLRVDLRKIAADERKDLLRITLLWEEMQNDPWFRYGEVVAATFETKLVKCERCRGFGHFKGGSDCPDCNAGKKQLQVEVKPAVVNIKPGLHAGGAGPALILADRTGSAAPIVHGGYFVIRALSTLNLGFGRGLYYRWLDMQGITQNALLKRIGASEEEAGGFKTDHRATTVSRVTGGLRVIKVIPSTGSVGLARGTGAVFITEDPSRTQASDPLSDPFLNLLEFDHAATEILFPLPNGLYGSSLHAANGTQQDSAPDDVVSDRLVPSPHPTRLQGGIISCGRCHGTTSFGAKDSFFFQPADNVTQELLRAIEPNVDLKALGLTREEFFKRISGLYEWRPEDDILPLARMFYARAVRRITKYPGMQTDDGKPKPFIETKEAWTELSRLFNRHAYANVDATDALEQLGYAVKDGDDPSAILSIVASPVNKPIPGLPENVQFDAAELRRADPTIALLQLRDPFTLKPRSVTSVQFAQIYADLAFKDIMRTPQMILDVPGAKAEVEPPLAPKP